MSSPIRVLWALVAILAAGSKATADIPDRVVGTWDVEKVAVDSQDPLHRLLQPDDPRLMGRVLVIGSGRVQFENGKEIGCKQSIWRSRRTTWGKLFADGLIRPELSGLNTKPKPEDYGVQVTEQQSVFVYPLCASANPEERFPRNPWIGFLGPELLAMHYDNQTVLILRRRPPGSRPKGSFDCGQATMATEKAICGNFELASWDRSVALAFQYATGANGEKSSDIRTAQKNWKEKRNACGTDRACIFESEWRRVDELMQMH